MYVSALFTRRTGDRLISLQAMGAMNKGLNLPAIQRIMNEFEKESATMDMKEEMMSDAVDDVMNDEVEDEEEEGDKILKEVLDEIGVDLSQQVRHVALLLNSHSLISRLSSLPRRRQEHCQTRWQIRSRQSL